MSLESNVRASSGKMRVCKICTTPSTRPRIEFNAEGICNACQHTMRKQEQIDWDEKESELKALCSRFLAGAPERQYDCVVPVSGGKDSHYQAWYVKNVLGLTPLCVSFRPLLPTAVGQQNLHNMRSGIGVDIIEIGANMQVYSKLTRIMLEEHGDPYKPFLYGVFSACAQIAIDKKIPLFFYGENGETEYGGSTDKLYTTLDTQGVHARIQSDRLGFKTPDRWHEYGIAKPDLRVFQELSAEDSAKIHRLFLADYVPWNNNEHLHFALNVIGGFKLSETRNCGYYDHGNCTDDHLVDFYMWFYWPKFGYGRATKFTSKEIHEGKMTRERAIELVKRYDGEFPWHTFDSVLKVLDLEEEDFWQIVERHIADEENIERERRSSPATNMPRKIPAWEKVGNRRWRLLASAHGEERTLQLPLDRPTQQELRESGLIL